jgi:hypothetical protein
MKLTFSASQAHQVTENFWPRYIMPKDKALTLAIEVPTGNANCIDTFPDSPLLRCSNTAAGAVTLRIKSPYVARRVHVDSLLLQKL